MKIKKTRNKVTPILLTLLLIVQMFLPVQVFLDPPYIEVQEANAAGENWETGYSYRKEIIIDHDQVSGSANLLNFPVLINIASDNDLRTIGNDGDVTDPEGDDIIFTDSDGNTNLDHEVEKYNASTGELVAHVRIPVLKGSENTIIYLYYGNSSISTSHENVTGVWNDDYKMIQHLKETAKTDGTYNDHLDSTSSNNDGEAEGGTVMDTTGKIDGADSFDGTNDYLNVADSATLDIAAAITIEAWVKKAVPSGIAITTCQELQDIKDNLSGDYYLANDIDCSATTGWNEDAGNPGTYFGFEPIGNTANGFTGNFNGRNYTINNLYVNRSDFSVGFNVGLFGRIINNASLSNIILENVNITGNMYTGSLLGSTSDDFAGNIKNCKGSGNVEGFGLTGGLIGYIFNANLEYLSFSGNIDVFELNIGGLIGFMSNSILKDSYAQININGIDYVGGLVGMLMDENSIINCYSSGSILAAFKMGGVVGVAEDSTLTNVFSTCSMASYNRDPVEKTGGLVGIFDNFSVNQSYWDIYRSNLASCVGEITSGSVDCMGKNSGNSEPDYWYYSAHAPMINWDFDTVWSIEEGTTYPFLQWEWDYLVSKGKDAYSLQYDQAGTLYGYISNNEITASVPTPTDWHHLVMTFDGTNQKLYVDGSLENTTAPGGAIGTNSTNLTISGVKGFFDGSVDEVRVSAIARSDEWIITGYNNQSAPSTFYTIGDGITDTTAPTGGSISYTNGYETDTTATITVNKGTDAESGISSVQLSKKEAILSNGECGSFSDWAIEGTQNTGTTSIDVTTESGKCYKFKYEATNGVGLTATYESASVLKVDTTAPTGSITNSSGDPINDTTPSLTLTIADTGVGIIGAQMRFSCDDSTYSTWESYATPKTDFNIRTGEGCVDEDGSKTVYVQFRDSLLNTSTSYNTGSFTLDTVSPFATFDSGAPDNPTNQNTTDITVAGTDVTHYKYKLDDGAYSNETAISVHLTLADLTDGEHTLYLIGKDITNNWQAEGSAIEHPWTVDVTSPIISLVSPFNNSSTNDTKPTFSWSGSDATSGIAKYQLYVDNSLDTDNLTNTSTTPTNNLSCGSHTWYVRAIDNVDNSTDSLTFNLIINCGSGLPSSSQSPPSNPEPTPENPENNFSVVINNNNESTNNQIVTLNLNAGSDTARMAISNTADFKYASQVDYQEEIEWELSDCKPTPNPSQEGNTCIVYAKFFTQYGVSSETVSDSIIYDPESENIPSTDSGIEPGTDPGLDPTDPDPSDPPTDPNNPDQETIPTEPTPTFTQTLQPGSNNNEVEQLQNKLKQLSFFPEDIKSNGNFGSTTKQAVIDYQKSKGIYPCGIIGPRTRKALNNESFISNQDYVFTKDLKYNDKNNEVKQLQTRLRDTNFFPYYVNSTGWFGPITEKAVKLFQSFYELIENGVVGKEMRGELN